MTDKPRTTNDVLRDARDILDQRYVSDENAPALVKEIDALLKPPSPAGQPPAGAPFIEHLRFNPTAGEELKARVTVHVFDTVDSRFRTITDDEALVHTLDADLDEAAYSAFINDAIAKALHESYVSPEPGYDLARGDVDPSTPGYIGIFRTPSEVLRILGSLGVEKGTELVNQVLEEYVTGTKTPTKVRTEITEAEINKAYADAEERKAVRRERDEAFVTICLPCWHMLLAGSIGPSTNFIADLKETSRQDIQRAVDSHASAIKQRNDAVIARDVSIRQLEDVNKCLDAAREDIRALERSFEVTSNARDGEISRLRAQLAQTDVVVAALEAKANNETQASRLKEHLATLRTLLTEVVGLMDHQGISTHKHRERIRDALRDTAEPLPGTPSVFAADIAARHGHDPETCEDCRGGWGHPKSGSASDVSIGYANVKSAATVLGPPPSTTTPDAFFDAKFRERLSGGKYTRWAVDIDAETLRLVLWFVGEYGCRGGLHEDVEPGIAHPRTLGASRVLVALEHGRTLSFDEAVRMMDGK